MRLSRHSSRWRQLDKISRKLPWLRRSSHTYPIAEFIAFAIEMTSFVEIGTLRTLPWINLDIFSALQNLRLACVFMTSDDPKICTVGKSTIPPMELQSS